MRVTNLLDESYLMWKGVDPDVDLEFLIRRYDTGHATVATRILHSGEAWSPEVALAEVAA